MKLNESKLRTIIREELLREAGSTMNSNYLQDTISTLLDDWSEGLKDAKKIVLDFLKSRLNQSYPGQEVSKEELHDIFKRPDAPSPVTDLRLSQREELINAIWNP